MQLYVPSKSIGLYVSPFYVSLFWRRRGFVIRGFVFGGIVPAVNNVDRVTVCKPYPYVCRHVNNVYACMSV